MLLLLASNLAHPARTAPADLSTLSPAAGVSTSVPSDGQNDRDQAEAINRGVLTVAHFDVSPPLRDIPERGTTLIQQAGQQDEDSVVQKVVGPPAIPTPILSFDGPSNTSGVAPPDPDGEAGPNHYVVMINLSFQIFSKTGTSLYGPALNNTLWSGFGDPCQSENAGDPIVLYDQLADRWLLSQFTAAGPTYYNCVALSTSNDPTGTYYRWAFSTGNNFPDYP